MAAPEPLFGKTVSHASTAKLFNDAVMGVVYKAQDTRLDRFVALKFLPDDVAHDRHALERFRREGVMPTATRRCPSRQMGRPSPPCNKRQSAIST